jgi:hypothetical protein
MRTLALGSWFLVTVRTLGFATAQSGVLPPHARRARHMNDRETVSPAGWERSLQEEGAAETGNNNTTAEQALRQELLADYDRKSFPFVQFWEEQSGIRTGLPVELGLNFHRVLSVDPTTSAVDLIVWCVCVCCLQVRST